MAYDNDKDTYQQRVMNQIKIIQTIVSKELRDGQKIVKNLIGEQTIEGEDTRYSFLQSVEMLGSLLSPYFPEKENSGLEGKEDINSQFEIFCDVYDVELREALDDEDFKKEIIKMFGFEKTSSKELMEEMESSKKTNEVNIYLLNYKIKIGRRMFRELVKLFKNNDFLGNEEFNEGSTSDGSTEYFDNGDENLSFGGDDE